MNLGVRQLALIDTKGPFPFITRRIYRHLDGTLQVWSSRRHKKGIAVGHLSAGSVFWAVLWRSLWMVHKINWWIGRLFALGSALFVLGSVYSLWPDLAGKLSLGTTAVNNIFFLDPSLSQLRRISSYTRRPSRKRQRSTSKIKILNRTGLAGIRVLSGG